MVTSFTRNPLTPWNECIYRLNPKLPSPVRAGVHCRMHNIRGKLLVLCSKYQSRDQRLSGEWG